MSAIKEKKRHSTIINQGRSKLTFKLTSEGWAHIYPKKEREEEHSRQREWYLQRSWARTEFGISGKLKDGPSVTDSKQGEKSHMLRMERKDG